MNDAPFVERCLSGDAQCDERQLAFLLSATADRQIGSALQHIERQIDANIDLDTFRSQRRQDAVCSLTWCLAVGDTRRLRTLYGGALATMERLVRAELEDLKPHVLLSVISTCDSNSEDPGYAAAPLASLWRILPKDLGGLDPFQLMLVDFGRIDRLNADPAVSATIRVALQNAVRRANRGRFFAEHVPFVLNSDRRDRSVSARVVTFIEAFEQAARPEAGCLVFDNGEHWVKLSNARLVRRKRNAFERRDDVRLASAVQIFRPRDRELLPRITNYFDRHAQRGRMIELGFQALLRGNMAPFRSEMFPSLDSSARSSSHSWDHLVSQLRSGDLLLTRNKRSKASSLIASIDDGVWSHVAYYIGNGELFEFNTDACGVKRIDRYADSQFAVAAYRSFLPLEDWEAESQRAAFVLRDNHYSFTSALVCGIQNLLNRSDAPPTPNGLIYTGQYRPIAFRL